MALSTSRPVAAQPEPGIAVELRTLTDRLLPMQPIRLSVRVAVSGNVP